MQTAAGHGKKKEEGTVNSPKRFSRSSSDADRRSKFLARVMMTLFQLKKKKNFHSRWKSTYIYIYVHKTFNQFHRISSNEFKNLHIAWYFLRALMSLKISNISYSIPNAFIIYYDRIYLCIIILARRRKKKITRLNVTNCRVYIILRVIRWHVF